MQKQRLVKWIICAWFFCLVCPILVLPIAAGAEAETNDNSTTRRSLWNITDADAGDTDTEETADALRKYALDGVFGEQALSYCAQHSNPTLQDLLDNCPAISDFYLPAQSAGWKVDRALRIHDSDGTRLKSATERLTKLVGIIFDGIVAFGWLTTTLTFTIMFTRYAVAPSHAIQQRALLMDSLKLGISAAILGNSWLIVSLFEAVFNRFWQTYAVYSDDWQTVFRMALSDYKSFIGGVTSVCIICVMGMFVVHFTMLAASGNSPMQQQANLKKVGLCALGAVGLGCIPAICSFLFHMI